ncbi:MAG: thiamine pyrophosphate-binding protein [Chloroflexi bacterium]|nr:MAG: thiamine pyrophosphate-binding protein [Chloroflexota bacterium]
MRALRMTIMTGGQAVVAALRAHDVKVVFGMPGVHNLALYDALCDAPEIQHVVVRHEQAAGFAADGYARATGRPGVAITTAGPGATNALTAIAEAWSDSSPVVLIASHIESPYVEQERGFGHELRGQLDVFRTATRYRARPMHVREIVPRLADAFAEAQRGRPRPVIVQIPQDVLNGSAEVDVPEPAPVARPEAAASMVRAAAGILARAQRPAIYAGVGIHRAGGHAELLAVAELLDAPVFTTAQGKGAIPEDHPLAVGNRWTGEAELIKFLSESDVLLAVGTRFGATDTSQWQLRLPAAIIQIDADADELNRNVPAEVALEGDAKTVLSQLLRELEGHPVDRRASRRMEVEELRQSLDVTAASAWPEPMRFLRDLRAGLARDAILFCDSLVQYWAARHFPVFAPRSMHLPWTFGTLGSSLPMAIGAKVAFLDRQVVALCGDGALMFTLPELATAVQARANIVIVVCNDRGYGAMRMHQRRRFGRFIASDLATPDFAAVAEAFGARGLRVNSANELGPALEAALTDTRPVLIDVPLALDLPWR